MGTYASVEYTMQHDVKNNYVLPGAFVALYDNTMWICTFAYFALHPIFGNLLAAYDDEPFFVERGTSTNLRLTMTYHMRLNAQEQPCAEHRTTKLVISQCGNNDLDISHSYTVDACEFYCRDQHREDKCSNYAMFRRMNESMVKSGELHIDDFELSIFDFSCRSTNRLLKANTQCIARTAVIFSVIWRTSRG